MKVTTWLRVIPCLYFSVQSRAQLFDHENYEQDKVDDEKYDPDKERESLSRLPLDQLIHLRQAVANGRIKDPWEATRPTMSSKKWKWPTKRDDDWWPEEEEESYWKPSYYEHGKKGKGGGLEKFFYTTITILSFLAFGGYILCLIIQSLRRINNGVIVVTTTMATTAAGRRRKRSLLEDTSSPVPFVDGRLDETFNALVSLSEAYAKYENLSRSGALMQP